jgi:hypothetical protein
MTAGRMYAFSDGVFSIAATLLVFGIALHPPGTPLEQVLHAWPSYLGYLISFLTIGAAWLAHSAMSDRLERADSEQLQTDRREFVPVLSGYVIAILIGLALPVAPGDLPGCAVPRDPPAPASTPTYRAARRLNPQRRRGSRPVHREPGQHTASCVRGRST